MSMSSVINFFFIFFFNATATTEIYTLSLHDALPISTLGDLTGRAGQNRQRPQQSRADDDGERQGQDRPHRRQDRKSTRLNSSHVRISYAVFCLKKKKRTLKNEINQRMTD